MFTLEFFKEKFLVSGAVVGSRRHLFSKQEGLMALLFRRHSLLEPTPLAIPHLIQAIGIAVLALMQRFLAVGAVGEHE